MNVLSLVTTPDPFYRDQVRVLEEKGVSVTTVDLPGDHPRSVVEYARFLPVILDATRRSCDLVHANYGLTAPFALLQPTRPVVLSLWGSDLFGRYGWLSRRCARYCDETIVMSAEMRRHLDVDARVLPHGVDLDAFRPGDRASARRTVGWASDASHVLFPYAPTRDVKNFPRAVRVVERARPRVDGPVVLHAVDDVPHESMPTYMNAADVLLLPSEREGSPNVVKEAMACNLPVVATDVGDVRERLRDVSPSVVGTTDDELVEGLVAILETDCVSDGRAAVRDLALSHMGERLVEVYQSLLDERG